LKHFEPIFVKKEAKNAIALFKKFLMVNVNRDILFKIQFLNQIFELLSFLTRHSAGRISPEFPRKLTI
jgi:hypothetical protein